ncbi:MAG TPA: hypothetical protein VND93_33450 [Myxococcales bacterium]|nr:hypothetical protein [Myxococcales bacterium]
MADNRINTGAPSNAGAAPTSTPAPAATPTPTAAPAPAAADSGRIVPKNWAQSLQVAASKGQQYLQEGFDKVTGRQPPMPPAPSGANMALQYPADAQALFGNVPPVPDMAGLRIEHPSNPASFPQPKTMFDLANISMSSYGGGQDQGKIALYSAGKTPDGHPVVVVDITGTEFDFSGQHSNLPSNWGASGSGAPTDLERETVAAIQDAYKRGDIPKDAVIDLTGHSLGAIVANNISGRPDADGHTGRISVAGADGAKSELPIRNVIGFGTPKPSFWSNDVNYFQRVGYADVVANLATDEVHGHRLNQWDREPNGPAHFDRERVHLHIPDNDLADGGHGQYNKNPAENPLSQEKLPPALQYSDGLKLIGAYKNPALGAPPPLKDSVKELEGELLSPRVQRDLDVAFPKWRDWLGAQTDDHLKNLPPGIRNEIGNSLDAVFSTYLDSDRFKNATPEQKKAIVKEDEARLRDVVKKIATPLADEILRQKVTDWWKDHVRLPW